jgi:DNA-binding Lrp family transcriptional regulator
MSKTIEEQQRFIELRANNESFNAIAKKLNVSKPTLIKWSRELEKEIDQAKIIELEAIQKQYFVSKQHRLIVLGKRLQKVREELDGRNMRSIPTERLMALEQQLTALLEREEVPLVLSGESEEMFIEPFKHTPTWTI